MAAERLHGTSRGIPRDIHAALVQDCQSGDRKAQFRLYQLYSKAMFNTCLRMLKHQEDAEDVLQDSFVDVFSKLDSYRGDSTIGAWIKRVVVNNCINFIQKKKIPLTDLEPARLENLAESPLEEELELDVQKVREALFQLPDGYRVTFSLYALEGYDHAEIAEILGTSIANSRSQYSRAKKKMREIIADKTRLIQGT